MFFGLSGKLNNENCIFCGQANQHHEADLGEDVVIHSACQYALLRLALPQVVSTTVMTGNLTNSVLSLMDLLSKGRTLPLADVSRLKRSLYLLAGFLLGCVVAAVAVSTLRDWAWALPMVLSGAAIALSHHR